MMHDGYPGEPIEIGSSQWRMSTTGLNHGLWIMEVASKSW